MLENYWKFPNRNVQTFGIVYHDTNGQVQYRRPSRSLNETCTVILSERQCEKVILEYGCEKVSNRECLLYTVKMIVLICVCGWHQIGWKELGCTQRQCEKSKDIVDNYRTMFESKNFCGENWKTSILGKYVYLFVVLRYGRSCQEMCGTILWVGKQDDPTTLQSIYSLHRWPPLQRRRIEIRWKTVKSLFSNCSEMLVLGTLEDLIFSGQWTNLQDPSQNGPKHVTNAWIVWFQKFIVHVKKDNIVMCVILPNNADWDCFKTLTSQEILKIQNPLLEEHCAFLEVIHICSHKLDVQETNFSFTQLNRITNHFFGCRIEVGWHLIVAVLGNTNQSRKERRDPFMNRHRSSFNGPKLLKIPTVRMPRYLDTSTSTKARMAKLMVQYGRPSCSSWKKSVRSPSDRTFKENGRKSARKFEFVQYFFEQVQQRTAEARTRAANFESDRRGSLRNNCSSGLSSTCQCHRLWKRQSTLWVL